MPPHLVQPCYVALGQALILDLNYFFVVWNLSRERERKISDDDMDIFMILAEQFTFLTYLNDG